MGATNLSIHQQEQIDIATLAKVFAHPARIAIINFIAKQNSCICGDIVEEVGLSQPTISQHLQVIKQAGLINGTFEGKSICYCLNSEKIAHIHKIFNDFFIKTLNNCCN
ncbi:MAG: ArsR/SmtB family transcription factor [Flavobacteriales bacterium]